MMPPALTSLRRQLGRLKAKNDSWRLQNSVLTLDPEPSAPPARGRVLLSYLNFAPHFEERQKGHTSFWECRQIAYTWRDLGFSVDVIAYSNARFEPRHAYDVCIDIHDNLERLAPLLPPRCLKILHATGAHWIYQNAAEYARLLALQERRGVTLIPRRIVPASLGIQTCDCATYVGNDFTASTFAFAAKPMTRIPLSTHYRADFPHDKDWNAARSRFLWMASTGAVLRGLDVVLEAFASLPHLHLDVCGDVAAETDFFAAYQRELAQLPNVSYHGLVSLESPLFERVSKGCGAMIYPSASEGCSGSVIAAAHAALVPVVPVSSGVDLGEAVWALPAISVEAVSEALATVSSWSPTEIERRARRVWERVNAQHTREIFAARYREFAQTVLARN